MMFVLMGKKLYCIWPSINWNYRGLGPIEKISYFYIQYLEVHFLFSDMIRKKKEKNDKIKK